LKIAEVGVHFGLRATGCALRKKLGGGVIAAKSVCPQKMRRVQRKASTTEVTEEHGGRQKSD